MWAQEGKTVKQEPERLHSCEITLPEVGFEAPTRRRDGELVFSARSWTLGEWKVHATGQKIPEFPQFHSMREGMKRSEDLEGVEDERCTILGVCCLGCMDWRNVAARCQEDFGFWLRYRKLG